MMRSKDALVLITGDRVGTVTGKIFEYLASGKRIILFSLVHNDAAKIIADIGDDDFVYVCGQSPIDEAAKALRECLARPFNRNMERIGVYDKKRQVTVVEGLIERFAQ